MLHVHQYRTIRRLAIGIVALLLAIAVFPPAQGRATASGGTAIVMSNQTANANANSDQPWTDTGPTLGGINTDVGIFRSGTGASEQTMLFYNVYTFQSDPVAGWQYVPLANGFGPIPNSAVQFSGGAKPTAATLSVDVDSLSSSSFQHWGPGGLVSLSWTLTPNWSYSTSGSSRSTVGFGGQVISFTLSGSSYNHSAQAQGSVVGYPMPNVGANNNFSLGTSQGVSVCRGCTPPPGP